MKATISYINTDLVVTLARITSQLQVLRCCGEEVKDHQSSCMVSGCWEGTIL